MAVGDRLCDLAAGDRIRVLGWLDDAERSLDLVARVVVVERRPAASDRPDDPASVGVTLTELDEAGAGFDEDLRGELHSTERLELFAVETTTGEWNAAEVWLTPSVEGGQETIGTIQYISRR